jgi:phosphatidylserine decarboxylase
MAQRQVHHHPHYLFACTTASMHPTMGDYTGWSYFSGDTWNVNPIALKRVEQLFCQKRARHVGNWKWAHNASPLHLVPVAAVLVASIRLHALDTLLHTRYGGPKVMACDAHFHKGQELGWFQHGSTILVFTPKHFDFAPGLQEGCAPRMGQALMRLPLNP